MEEVWGFDRLSDSSKCCHYKNTSRKSWLFKALGGRAIYDLPTCCYRCQKLIISSRLLFSFYGAFSLLLFTLLTSRASANPFPNPDLPPIKFELRDLPIKPLHEQWPRAESAGKSYRKEAANMMEIDRKGCIIITAKLSSITAYDNVGQLWLSVTPKFGTWAASYRFARCVVGSSARFITTNTGAYLHSQSS